MEVVELKLSVVSARSAPDTDPVLLKGDLTKSAEIANEIGYDALEIHAKSPEELKNDAFLSAIDASHMKVCAFATGMAKRIEGLCFLADDSDKRLRSVQRVCEFLDFAAPLGAAVVVGSIRGAIPDRHQRAEYDRRMYDCLTRCVDRAEKVGAVLLVEVINRYENNYLNSAEETLEYLHGIDSERLKLNLDTFHMNIEETDSAKAVRMCGKRLGHVHLADNTRGYPGTGTYNFDALFEATREIGYDGYFSVECMPYPDGVTAARRAMEYLKRYQRREAR